MGATNNISKSFLINRSEIEGRIDPHQFHIERREAIDKIKRNNEILKLKHVVKNVKTTTTNICETDIYIGLENIESNTGEYVATNDKQSISSAGVFKEGHILFPKLRPYLNKVYLAEFDGLCSTEFHIFKSDKFSNEFLSIYLRSDLIVNQTKHLMTGNTLPRLQTEDINNLPVPNIGLDEQNKIVELYKNANKKKQQKELQAQELLKSIDTYMLNELGITLPIKDNSIESRMFEVKFNNLVSRLEPFYYQSYFEKLNESLNNGKYKTEKLKNLCNLLNGFAFQSSDYIDFSDVLNIRMSNIRPNNEFNPDYNARYLPNNFKEIYKHYLLSDGDIIIAMTDMAADPKILGVPTFVSNSNNRFLLLNQRVGKLYDFKNHLVNVQYLCNILGSKLIKDYYNQQGARGVQINISREQILSAFIPLPPLEKQNEIADNIQKIRGNANQLQADAKRILDNAKQEVEKIIIGN